MKHVTLWNLNLTLFSSAEAEKTYKTPEIRMKYRLNLMGAEATEYKLANFLFTVQNVILSNTLILPAGKEAKSCFAQRNVKSENIFYYSKHVFRRFYNNVYYFNRWRDT